MTPSRVVKIVASIGLVGALLSPVAAHADVSFSTYTYPHPDGIRHTYLIANNSGDSLHTVLIRVPPSILSSTGPAGWLVGADSLGSEHLLWWRAQTEASFIVPGAVDSFSYVMSTADAPAPCIRTVDDLLDAAAHGECASLVLVMDRPQPPSLNFFAARPNPSDGQFHLGPFGSESLHTWTAYDVRGRRRAWGRFGRSGEMDLSLESGQYFIRIQRNGKEVGCSTVTVVR